MKENLDREQMHAGLQMLKKGTLIPHCSAAAGPRNPKKGATAMQLEARGLAIFVRVSKGNRYEGVPLPRVWHLAVKGGTNIAALNPSLLDLNREKDLVTCSCMRLLRR